MTGTYLTLRLSAAAVTLAAAALAHAQPSITNGRVTQHAGTPLRQAFDARVAAATGVAWIGYTVPAVPGERHMCCATPGDCCAACRLDPDDTAKLARPVTSAGPVRLESGQDLAVLFRIQGGHVERLRVFSDDCALDAGGREVAWLTAVRPQESILLLERVIVTAATGGEDIASGAIAAIALHADAAADAALQRLVRSDRPEAVRRHVPFWLGQARGAAGLSALRAILADDPSPAVRKAAVFGLSQSREPEALHVLLDTARTHREAATRADAIFWLGQRAGQKAAGAIADRVEHDPDEGVKKRAVFALSQLPPDEGVPLLIRLARTHSSPVVRKQAVFWLGQSKDPRAVDFFAEILR